MAVYLDPDFIEKIQHLVKRVFPLTNVDPIWREDLAQEVCLRFLEGKGEHQSIKQAYFDACRATFHWKSRKEFERRQTFPLEAAENEMCLEMSVEERMEVIQRLLALPPYERTLLYCRYWLDLDVEEIAALAGVQTRKIYRDLERILMKETKR